MTSIGLTGLIIIALTGLLLVGGVAAVIVATMVASRPKRD